MRDFTIKVECALSKEFELYKALASPPFHCLYASFGNKAAEASVCNNELGTKAPACQTSKRENDGLRSGLVLRGSVWFSHTS